MTGSNIHIQGSARSGEGSAERSLLQNRLTVIKPVCEASGRKERLDDLLLPLLDELAASGTEVIIHEHISGLAPGELQNSRVLFAVSLSKAGVNMEYYRLLEYLRGNPTCLKGSVGGIVIDGDGEFYTKATSRRLAFSANMDGCTLPGKPLVEATGSLGNFHVLSNVTGLEPVEVYREQLRALLDKLISFEYPEPKRLPKILALHASTRRTSNTLLLWDKVKRHLNSAADIKEISLRNGEIYDCRGCSYEACLHYGEQASCFYGGIITEQVFPALLESDILVLICPNYNDAVSANLTAFINRLTSIFRSNDFSDKRVYSIIVSGYSGGDIIAEQLIGALCFNKSFILPPGFAMLETANDPKSILRVENIDQRAREFAAGILGD